MAQGSRTVSRSAPRRIREGRRLNRAEQRAMEIRRRETAQHLAASTATAEAASPTEGGVPVIAGDTVPEPARGAGTTTARRGRNAREVARTITLTRDQEYRFIRSDLRRLFVLSAVLVVLMVIALIVVESLV